MIATLQGRSGLNAVLDSSEFYLPAYDAGAGAVNTTLTRGVGPATFTRATAAWTKLSTGLWASVATGVARSSYIGLTTAPSAYGGYFQEGAGTQLVTPTASIRDMTNAAWTPVSITPALTGIGIDGVTNSCSRLTCTSNGGTILQTLVAAGSSRTYSCWMMRVTGTGTITIQQGATTLDVTASLNSSTFTLVQLNANVLNAAFGIVMGTSGDVILVDFNQFEAGAFATSPMDAAGAVRNEDVLTYPKAGNALDGAGTAFVEIAGTLAGSNGVLHFGDVAQSVLYQSGNVPTEISSSDGVSAVTKTGLSSTATAVRKRIVSWSGSSRSITGDGLAVSSGAYDGTWGGAAIRIGEPWYGTLKNIRIWQRALPDATLQAITA